MFYFSMQCRSLVGYTLLTTYSVVDSEQRSSVLLHTK